MRTRLFAVFSLLFVLTSFVLGPLAAAEEGFVAGKESKRYHRADCALVKRIYKPERVYFESAAKAVKAGYAPCPVCHPERALNNPWGAPPRPGKAGSSMNMPSAVPKPAEPDSADRMQQK